MEIEEIIYYTILLAGAGIGLAGINKSVPASRWLTVLFIYIIIKEIAAKLFAHYTGSNLEFYRLTGIIDFILTSLVFLSIPAMQAVRKVIYILAAAVFCFYLVSLFKWEPPQGKADTYFKLVRNFVLVGFALLLFMRLYRHIDEETIFRKSSFWVAAGCLVFYCFSIFYWGVFNYYVAKEKAMMTDVLRPVFTVANYILYTFLAIAIRLNKFN
jgi:hypothetical protein